MFNVSRERRFSTPVSVMTPVEGGHVEETLSAVFNYMTIDEFNKFDFNTSDGTRRFLETAIVRLDDLVDDKNQPVPYSHELRDRLLALPNLRLALYQSYKDAVLKAKAGN